MRLSVTDTSAQGRWDLADYTPARGDRYFFRNFKSKTTPAIRQKIASGSFGLLMTLSGKTIPLDPVLRTRAVHPNGFLQLSWIQYQPTSLLYDYQFWGGREGFLLACQMDLVGKVPRLQWEKFLPPMWARAWRAFLDMLINRNQVANTTKDGYVLRLLPIFHNKFNRLPFRVLSGDEVLQVAGLADHFVTFAGGILSPYICRGSCAGLLRKQLPPRPHCGGDRGCY